MPLLRLQEYIVIVRTGTLSEISLSGLSFVYLNDEVLQHFAEYKQPWRYNRVLQALQ